MNPATISGKAMMYFWHFLHKQNGILILIQKECFRKVFLKNADPSKPVFISNTF